MYYQGVEHISTEEDDEDAEDMGCQLYGYQGAVWLVICIANETVVLCNQRFNRMQRGAAERARAGSRRSGPRFQPFFAESASWVPPPARRRRRTDLALDGGGGREGIKQRGAGEGGGRVAAVAPQRGTRCRAAAAAALRGRRRRVAAAKKTTRSVSI